MTKAELVEKVSSKINLTKKQTEEVVNTVFQSITERLRSSLTRLCIPAKSPVLPIALA